MENRSSSENVSAASYLLFPDFIARYHGKFRITGTDFRRLFLFLFLFGVIIMHIELRSRSPPRLQRHFCGFSFFQFYFTHVFNFVIKKKWTV